MRRLTRTQYENTVRDLLGDRGTWADRFTADAQLGPFANNHTSPVTPLVATQVLEAAEILAEGAKSRLDSLLPCHPSGAQEERGCAERFVTTFGLRAYRRPLTESERKRFLALYDQTRTQWGYGFADAVRLLIQAFLQSPHFLNHVELGDRGSSPAPSAVPLQAYELASRLSYFLWNTMPDDELFAAAASGQLLGPEGLAQEVDRMLASPKARDGALQFARDWLDLPRMDGVEKNRNLFPSWSDHLRRSFRRETEAFFSHVLWESEGRFDSLLTAPYSFVNAATAAVYGVSISAGDSLVRAELDPRQRAGLLTHGSFLSLEAHPEQTSVVKRGKFVRERFLCQIPPTPPPDVSVSVPKPEPGLTTRERFALHTEDPSCSGCHQMMDPIGFGFEGYDPIGAYRTTDNGRPVDDRGEIIGSVDVNGPFAGAVELVQRLAGSVQVRDCFVQQWFRFATGRDPQEEDTCSLWSLGTQFDASSGHIPTLLRTIALSDAFRFRKPITPAEELCP